MDIGAFFELYIELEPPTSIFKANFRIFTLEEKKKCVNWLKKYR